MPVDTTNMVDHLVNAVTMTSPIIISSTWDDVLSDIDFGDLDSAYT